jgi:hypothetical protein
VTKALQKSDFSADELDGPVSIGSTISHDVSVGHTIEDSTIPLKEVQADIDAEVEPGSCTSHIIINGYPPFPSE